MKKKDKLNELLDFYEKHMPKNIVLVKRQKRYEEVKLAIQEIADFVWNISSDASVKTKTDDLIGSSVCLEIISSLIVIDEMDKFCQAISKADNFEIYPRTDGTVAMNITFHNVFEAAPPIKK